MGAWYIRRETQKRIHSGDEDYLENIFDLSRFLKTLDELIKLIDDKLTFHKSVTRGAPLKKVNLVASIWHSVITGKFSIVNIVNLLDWFRERFKNVAIYEDFCREIMKIQNEKLMKSLYRQRREGAYKNYIEEGISHLESPVGSYIISFRKDGIATSRPFELDWENSDFCPDLVTFPDGEKLTVEDFIENSRKAKVSYKNRAYQSFLNKTISS